VIWVKVPSLPASGNTTLYLYYGNPAAAGTSNGSAAFEFFDGFEQPFGDAPLANAPTWQNTPTYDGSGQVVNPDVVYFPSGWHGYKYWLAMTPYPNSNDDYENPSILVSNDGAPGPSRPGSPIRSRRRPRRTTAT